MQYSVVPKLKKYILIVRLKATFYTCTLCNVHKEIYTNILSELNPVSKSKCLNFKQNPVQSARSVLQAESLFDFSLTQFYSIDLLHCAGEI